MKTITPFIMPLMASLLALSGCQSTPFTKADKHVVVTAPTAVKDTYPVLPPAQNMVRLTEGQTLTLKDKPLTVSFDKVLSDSRCPTDTQCIWAGNATIAVTVTPTNSASKTIHLSTGDLRGDLVRKTTVAGYDVSLETLYPTPTLSVGLDKLTGKYMVDLKVVPATP